MAELVLSVPGKVAQASCLCFETMPANKRNKHITPTNLAPYDIHFHEPYKAKMPALRYPLNSTNTSRKVSVPTFFALCVAGTTG